MKFSGIFMSFESKAFLAETKILRLFAMDQSAEISLYIIITNNNQYFSKMFFCNSS